MTSDEWQLVLDETDLDGLPEFARAAAAAGGRRARARRGAMSSPWRALCGRAVSDVFVAPRPAPHRLWRRGPRAARMPGAHDNAPLIGEIVALRAEQARLLGYDNFAAYRLDDTMAQDPGGGRAPAAAGLGAGQGEGARRTRGARARWRRAEGLNEPIAAVGLALLRREGAASRNTTLDEAEVKPYFVLDNMVAGRVRHRRAAVRPHLCRAPRSARSTTRMCASGRCATGRASDRPLPARQFRPARQAVGRLDRAAIASRKASTARYCRSSSTTTISRRATRPC